MKRCKNKTVKERNLFGKKHSMSAKKFGFGEVASQLLGLQSRRFPNLEKYNFLDYSFFSWVVPITQIIS